jgi:cytochrome c551
MKKKLVALLMGTTVVLSLAACGGGDKATDTPAAGDGEKLYGQKCAACHGQNLEGLTGLPLNKIGAKLSKDQIEKVILEGQNNNAMPKGMLTGDDAATVAEWLSTKK